MQINIEDLFREDIIKIGKPKRDHRRTAYGWISEELDLIANDMETIGSIIEESHSARSNG